MQRTDLWKELNEDKSLPELFQSIPARIPEVISLALACSLSLMPIISLLISITDGSYFFKYPIMQTAFNTIGYFGISFCLFIIVWNKYNLPKVYRSKLEILRDSGLIIFLGLMLFWTILSTTFSKDLHLALWGYVFQGEGLFTVLGYAGCFVIAINIKQRRYIKLILNIFVASASVIAALCLINTGKLMAFVNMDPSMAYFSNQNHYGYFICMALMSAVLLCVTDENPNSKKTTMILLLHILELGLVLNALIQAHSLGPFLAVIIALISLFILTIFVDKTKIKRVLLIIFFAITIMGISSIFTWDISSDLYIFNSSLEDLYYGGDKYGFGSGRGTLWIHTVELIKQRPLFGYGLDNLSFPNNDGILEFGRPHCEILQFAACQGIPAALFYVSGLGCLLAMFVNRFKRIDILTLCMYCIIGAYLISSIVGNPKFYTSSYYYMLLGLCYSNIKTFNKS